MLRLWLPVDRHHHRGRHDPRRVHRPERQPDRHQRLGLHRVRRVRPLRVRRLPEREVLPPQVLRVLPVQELPEQQRYRSSRASYRIHQEAQSGIRRLAL